VKKALHTHVLAPYARTALSLTTKDGAERPKSPARRRCARPTGRADRSRPFARRWVDADVVSGAALPTWNGVKMRMELLLEGGNAGEVIDGKPPTEPCNQQRAGCLDAWRRRKVHEDIRVLAPRSTNGTPSKLALVRWKRHAARGIL
jgi:hypothetical protein